MTDPVDSHHRVVVKTTSVGAVKQGEEVMQSHAARVLYFAIVCLMFGAPSFAAEKHLLLGTWSVDVSKLQQPSPPKSVTIKLEEAGNGAYHMTVDIEACYRGK